MISALVFAFAAPLMQIFVSSAETAVIASGVRYLRIEGAFYFGIGCLFLLYGYYRAIKRAEMSVVLTVISLGTRVLLAYMLSATAIGEVGIWMAIPIGWVLADLTGLLYMKKNMVEKTKKISLIPVRDLQRQVERSTEKEDLRRGTEGPLLREFMKGQCPGFLQTGPARAL